MQLQLPCHLPAIILLHCRVSGTAAGPALPFVYALLSCERCAAAHWPTPGQPLTSAGHALMPAFAALSCRATPVRLPPSATVMCVPPATAALLTHPILPCRCGFEEVPRSEVPLFLQLEYFAGIALAWLVARDRLVLMRLAQQQAGAEAAAAGAEAAAAAGGAAADAGQQRQVGR